MATKDTGSLRSLIMALELRRDHVVGVIDLLKAEEQAASRQQGSKPPTRKWTMSAAARKKISIAAKKRWAKTAATKKPAKKVS